MLALARFGSDPLRFLDGLRDDERDVVPFSLGNVHCHLLKRPEHLKLVLESEDWPPLSRGRLMALDKWYGGGLILTEGAEHHRQRDELWKPVLADAASPAIAVARAARRAGSWKEGAPVELFSELRSLCWSIDWEALTGEDLDEAPELLKAQETGTAAMQWLLGPFGTARWGSPAPTSVRTRAARSRLDGAIDAMIAERRARPRDDVLSRWVEREDDDQVIQATFKQWLGADQLHALFTWTLHLLAYDADVEARWHAELDEVLGDRPATADDVSALTFTRRVVKESLRLYPPIWGFFRQVTGDYRLDGASIPQGHVIAMSQWVTHRDPGLWEEPERFDPERWADGAQRPPAISYFPFSAGPYECHARGLAVTEAVLVLATLGQQWGFRPADERAPRPTATGTIVPKGGMRMRLSARRPGLALHAEQAPLAPPYRTWEGRPMDDVNRRTVERFWEAFNTRDLSLLDDLFAEDYVNHATIPGTPPGPAGQAQLMQRLWTAFPDARFEIEHLAQDADTVVCVGTMAGTHEGELFGIPGSRKPVAWRQCHLITVADGKATAHRAIRDDLGLMRQMGAIPGG